MVLFPAVVMPLYLLLSLVWPNGAGLLLRVVFRGYCVFLTRFYLPLLRVSRDPAPSPLGCCAWRDRVPSSALSERLG